MLFFSKRNPKNRDILDFACQITLLEVSNNLKWLQIRQF